MVMVDIWISVTGTDPVGRMEDLDSRLSEEPELRGRVQQAEVSPASGELGAVADALVAALGTGGVASVLAASLRTFLAQPHGSDLRIVAQDPEERWVGVDAKRVNDVEGLVRRALGQAE
jgi:Effector Associated Constant Component 1